MSAWEQTRRNTELHVHRDSRIGPQINTILAVQRNHGIAFRPWQDPSNWFNPAQASITATDNNYSANIHFYTKTPGGIGNALVERVTIQNGRQCRDRGDFAAGDAGC